MSAKKTAPKKTKAKAAVKAAPARKTAAKKTAKTVVAAKPNPARAALSKAVKTTLAMQTANAPFIKGVDPEPAPKARIVKAVGKGKRVTPPAEAFPTQQAEVPKYTMARSYMRKGAPGEGQLRRGTYQCTVSFTPEQMAQVREAAVFRAVSLAELIRSFVVAHLNANAGPS